MPVAEHRGLGLATDHELVGALRRGDDRAFEKLYERYQRRIAAYVYGMVNDYGRAEDITQEVFISALRRMRETERPIAFKPWIYEIAKNACIDQFRRSRRAEEISFDADEGAGAMETQRLAAPGATPDVAMDAKQQLSHLCGAFGGLSDTHHQILVLRELEGLSYREIGEKMGLSRPSVESTLFRARRRLTEEYDELITGQRCSRIQTIITTAGDGALGARDQRRLAKHIAHCQPCRREARLAGLESAALSRTPREAVAARVAAVLPFPALLRGRRGQNAVAAEGHGSGLVAQWGSTLTTMAEPLAGWTKAAVAAAAVLVAGGAGVAGHEIATSGGDREGTGGAVVAPAKTAKQSRDAGGTTSAARQKDGSGARGTGAPPAAKPIAGSPSGTPISGGAKAPGAGNSEPTSGLPVGDGAPVTPSVVRDATNNGGNGSDRADEDSPLPTTPPSVTVPNDTFGEAEKLGTQVDPAVGGAVGDARDVAEPGR